MTFLLAILGAIIGAVAGYTIAAFGAFAIAGAFGMSDFEGGRGMFAAFFAGPAGGVIGLVACVVLVVKWRAPGSRA